MNKFIKYDIENGLTLIKCGIRNALHDLDTGELTEFKIDEGISVKLIELCAEECHWKTENLFHFRSPSGKRFLYDSLTIKPENED